MQFSNSKSSTKEKIALNSMPKTDTNHIMDELNNSAKNLEMCRLCLKLTVMKINIFANDFAKMIEILTSLKIRPSDDMPQITCLKCARDVKVAFLVRRRIIQSYSKLNGLSNNKDNPRNAVESDNFHTSPNNDFNSQMVVSSEGILQQLQKIIRPSEIEESDFVSLNNSSPKELSNAENTDSLSQFADNVEIKNKFVENRPIEPSVSMKFGLSEEQADKIQNLKLTINTKYLAMINSYKRKALNSNKNDRPNIRKCLESIKNITKQPKNNNVQRKKREPSNPSCNICQIKFPSKIKYKNHMCRHRSKICPICDKQIRSAYLKRHMTIHEDSPAVCEHCGAACKNPISLRMHIFYYHKSNESVCEDCGRSFKTKTKLSYHRRKDHSNDRSFKCETCGKCFFTKLYLTKHINMKHMKLRPHICEYCGKGFSGRHALRTHIRRHTNEAPYRCNFCEESFRQRVSLRGHLRSRHKVQEENKAFCETCGKGFATSVALDVHKRLHQVIKCPRCPDTFAEKSYLDQHVNICHSS